MCNMNATPSEEIIHHDAHPVGGTKQVRIIRSDPKDVYIGYPWIQMSQIRSLLERKEHCTQSIRIKCNGAPIFASNGTQVTFLMSREGKKIPLNDNANFTGCECSRNKSCAGGMHFSQIIILYVGKDLIIHQSHFQLMDIEIILIQNPFILIKNYYFFVKLTGPQSLCNCDSDVDDIVVTDKNMLPITKIQFAKLGRAAGNVLFTLSPVICKGWLLELYLIFNVKLI